MKRFLLVFQGVLFFLLGTVHLIREVNASDSVFCDDENRIISYNQTFDNSAKEESEEIARFLKEMHDSRLMDTEEGKLARDKGTTFEIRNYGTLMVTDQAILDQEIIELARSENVVLPSALSPKKANALEDLRKLNGKRFDKQFKRMIKKDHRRDIKYCKRASNLNDKEVSSFAKQKLPLIKSHLEKLQKIK